MSILITERNHGVFARTEANPLQRALIVQIPKDPRKTLALIFVAAVAVRLSLMLILQSYAFRSEWEYGFEYGRMARWVALGQGFSSPYSDVPRPSAMMPPAYVFFMALIFRVFGVYTLGSAIVIETAQLLMAAASCVIFYGLGTKMFNQKVGLFAALGLAFYPPSVFFSIMRIGPVTLVVILLGLITHYLLKLRENLGYGAAVTCGFLMGFAALVQPTVIPFFVLAYVWLFVYSPAPRFSAVKPAIVMGLASVLCILPWTIRNYAVFGELVLIKSPLGRNLLFGNNPYGNGVIQYARGLSSSEEINGLFSAEEIQQMQRLDEVDEDRLMLRKAMSFMRERPETFLRLTLRRLYAFWSLVNPYKETAYDSVRGASYGSVLILAVIGVLLAQKYRREMFLVLSLFLSYPLSYYITHVSYYRFRYPVEPFLILLAAYALTEVAERARGRSWSARFRPLEIHR